MSGWAYELAEGLLAGALPRRWQHSLGVWRQAQVLGLGGDDGLVLESAAVLHDIGYAPSISVSGFHPLDGAVHMTALDVDTRVVRLVANHSCAAVEAEERDLSAELARFPPLGERRDLMDALIWADMTTSPDGSPVTMVERVDEVLGRYGAESLVGRFIERARPALAAACRRVESNW